MATNGKGREYWEPHLEALRSSGLTSVAYAREHGLSVHSLGWWRRRLMGRSTTRVAAPVKPRSSTFVALKVAEPPMVRSVNVTISIGSDVRLQLSELPSPAWLAQLGVAMRGAR